VRSELTQAGPKAHLAPPRLTSSKLQRFGVVRDLLDWRDIDALQTCAEANLLDEKECRRALEKAVLQALGKKKQLKELTDDGLRKLKTIAYKFVNRAVDYALEDGAASERGFDENSPETLDAVADYLGRDVYVLDGKTRAPDLKGTASSAIKGRGALVCLRLHNQYYEPVGRIGHYRGNIQRDFKQDDPLIRRLRVFVSSPELVAQEYPDLIPYLPQSLRPQSWLPSDEEEEESSDSCDSSHSDNGK
jgi:hypothetical protein